MISLIEAEYLLVNSMLLDNAFADWVSDEN